MQSAPNTERVLHYLNSKGHSYSNERALIEACKDPKIFNGIFKDLLESSTPQFVQSWIALEGYTFSSDPERIKNSLPVLNDFLVNKEMLEQLGTSMRLSKMLGKKLPDRVPPNLNTVVGFLEAKQKLEKSGAQLSEKHQLMINTCKSTSILKKQVEDKLSQVRAEKKMQKQQFDLKNKELQIIADRTQKLQDETKHYSIELSRMMSDFRDQKSILNQKKMEIQKAELLIAQCKRELIQLAPDVKREKEHIEVKINDLWHMLNYGAKVQKNILEKSDGCSLTLQRAELKLNEELRLLMQRAQNYNKKSQQILELKGKQLELEHTIERQSKMLKIKKADLTKIQERGNSDYQLLERQRFKNNAKEVQFQYKKNLVEQLNNDMLEGEKFRRQVEGHLSAEQIRGRECIAELRREKEACDRRVKEFFVWVSNKVKEAHPYTTTDDV